MPFAPQWTWTEVPASLDEILALEAEIRIEAAPPDSEARFALTATAEPACPRLPGEQGIDTLAGLLLCAVQPLLDEGALSWTPTVIPDPELHYIGQVYRRDEGWVLRQDAAGLRAARRQQTDDARESSLLSFGNIQDLREIAWWDADGHLVRYLRYELSTSAGDYWGDVPYIELVSSLALRWEGDALVGVDATVGELPHQLPATLRFEPFRIGLALRPGEEQPRVAALSTVESWLPLGPSQTLSTTSALWVALNATLRRFLTHPGPTEPAWGASPHDRAAVGPLPVRLQQSSDEPTLWRARSWRKECEGGLRCFSQDELLLDYEADRLRWAYVRSNSTMTPEDLVLELTWHGDELWRANLLWRDASAWGVPDTFGALELRWGDGR